jgi:hypothetical protein
MGQTFPYRGRATPRPGRHDPTSLSPALRKRSRQDHGFVTGQSPWPSLTKTNGKICDSFLTFLEHPEIPPDNNNSERELRPTATYRKVTGGFRSDWGAELFAGIRSIVGTAARQDLNPFDAIRSTLGIIGSQQLKDHVWTRT